MKIKRSFRILKLCSILVPIITIPIISTKIEIKKTRSRRSVTATIPKVGLWNHAPGTNITKGQNGTIFQAQNGDLYAMGAGTELQVLKGGKLTDGNQFETALGTTTKGQFGTIFQAQNGDLYAMGNETKLQVLRGGKLTDGNQFETAPGTNITRGQFGTIFQARNGDLYAMGFGTGLQVLKGGVLTGGNEFETATGTNITRGEYGAIFQAQNDDLYAMGHRTGLQILKGGKLTGDNQFIDAPNASIDNGGSGTIFQARNGDLYAMGFGTELQVLKGGELTGDNQFIAVPGTNITNGGYGTIFQAQNGDLYAMGYVTGLQVLKGGELTPGKAFETAPETNIAKGQYGTIFQAQNGDLYAMGNETKLQVLRGGDLTGDNQFIDAPGTNITNGGTGTIFQARNGDLYAMGFTTKLQVLKGGVLTSDNQFIDVPGTNITNGGNGTIFQAQNDDLYAMGHETRLQVLLKFIKTNETKANADDGTIIITSFNNDSSKLQYKALEEKIWNDLPITGVIHGLSPRKYQFQWKSKNGEYYAATTSDIQAIPGFQEILAWKNNQEWVNIAVTKFEATTGDGLKARKINDDNLDSNLITGKGFLLPSELVGTITANNLGFTEPSPLTNVTITYSIASYDDAAGTIVVQAIITSISDPNISTTVYFKLSGYQITTQRNVQNQNAVNDVFDWFKGTADGGLQAKDNKGNIVTPINVNGKNNVLPSEISTLNATNLGIKNWIGYVNVVYTVDEGDANNNDGTIIVKATISKQRAISKVVYFKLSGYQTTSQRAFQNEEANEKVNNATNWFKGIGRGKLHAKDNKKDIDISISVTGKNDVLPSEIPIISATSLGIENLIGSNVDSVSVVYTVDENDANDNDGTIIVKATISKNRAISVVYFKLSWYQTTSQRTVQNKKVNDATNWFKGTEEGRLHAKDNKKDIDTSISAIGKSSVLPSSISTINVANLGIQNLIGFNVDNVNVVYEGDANDNDGTIIVKATISKNGAISKVIYFELSGYQTTTQKAQADVDAVADAFKSTDLGKLKAKNLYESDNNLVATDTTFANKETTLPSELRAPFTSTNIGFVEPSKGSVSIEYAVVPTDADGTVIVTATIKKTGVLDKVVKFKLSGYQTTVEKTRLSQAAVDAVVDAFKSTDSGKLNAKNPSESDSSLTATTTTFANKETTLPSELKAPFTSTNIGFVEPAKGFVDSIEYVVAPTDANGTVIVTATIKKAGVLDKVVKFKLSGYQTTVEKTRLSQAVVDAVADAFKSTDSGKLNAKNPSESDSFLTATTTTFTNRATTLPSELRAPFTSTNIGFVEPSKGSVSIEYAVVPTDADGTVIVTATIKKAGVLDKVVKFKLSGYQTTVEKTRLSQAAVDAVVDAFKSTDSGKLNAKNPSESDSSLTATTTTFANKETTLPSELRAPFTSTNIGFVEPTKGSVDSIEYVVVPTNADGTVIVTATIKKAGVLDKAVKFKLSGYQTIAHAQAAVADVADAFKSTDSGKLNAKNPSESDSSLTATTTTFANKETTLPSELKAPFTSTNIGFVEPAKGSVSIEYAVVPTDADGTVIVTATIKKASVLDKVVKFKLSGYQTTVHAQATVDAVADAFKSTNLGKLKAKNLSESDNSLEATRTTLSGRAGILLSTLTTSPTPERLGFTAPSPVAGVSVSYAAIHDNATGTIIVTATITKTGTTSKIVKFKLSGYQTIIQKAQAAVDVVAYEFKKTTGKLKAKNLSESDSSLVATDTTLIDASTTLPSTLTTDPTLEKLGFTTPSLADGVSVSYVAIHDNAMGTIIVTATITKTGATSKIVKFKLSGYQTTVQKAKAAVAVAVAAFKSTDSGKLKAKNRSESDNSLEATDTTLTDASITLPSTLTTDPTPEKLGFIVPSLVDGVSINYVAIHDDATGTVIVTATITKTGATSKIVKFKLSGYQTTNQRAAQNQKAIEDTFNIINGASSANYNGSTLEAITDWTLFPSKTFDIDISTIPEEVIVKYKHPILNEDGVFVISFHISKGLVSKEFTKKINATIKDESNNVVILGITIPIGIIFLAGTAYLIFKKMKKK